MCLIQQLWGKSDRSFKNKFGGKSDGPQCRISHCSWQAIYHALDKPRNLKRAALILSSGDQDVYDGVIYAYKRSFLEYLKLTDMGIYTAFGDQNKSEETLSKLNAFGQSLSDIDKVQGELA